MGADDVPGGSPPPDRTRGGGGVLVLLVLANLLSYFDRQFLLVASAPLQHDMGLSDVQIGLLGGFSFALCYAVFGLPLSVLVDRYSRRAVIIGSILVWSAGTFACGLSGTFVQLFAARMIVGIGEAGLAPAAYSLIGSTFARADIPRASGLYAVGAALGTGLAIALGGTLLGGLAAMPLPFGMHNWQAGFILFGLAGLPLALVALRLGRHVPVQRGTGPAEDSGTMPAYVWRNRGLYLPLLACACLYMAFLSGFLAWAPVFFIRRFGWSLAQAGALFGSVFLIFNTISGPVGGIFATWLGRRAGRDRTIELCLACLVLLLIVATLGPLAPWPWLALVLLGIAPLFSGILGSLVPALIVIVSPAALRGRVIALFLFCMMVLGYGVGPLLYGWFTEHVLASHAALHLSLAIISPVLLGLAFLALARARVVMRHEPAQG